MEKEMLAEVQLRGVCNMPDATQKLGTIWTIVGTRLGEWLNFWIQISNKRKKYLGICKCIVYGKIAKKLASSGFEFDQSSYLLNNFLGSRSIEK